MIAIIKPFACIALAVMLGSGPAFAASSQCRFIQSRTERNACYDRQSPSAKQTPAASENTKPIDPIERMKQEDDRLAKRLQGICRGC